MSRAGRGRGFTLAEVTVALVLAAAVLGAAYQVLLHSQRFYRLQAAVLEVHRGMRAAVQVLTAELRELDASGGDLVAIASDSVSIRAARRLEFVCAAPDVGAASVILRNSLSYGFRAADPTRDRALVYRDGDATADGDDAWVDFGISSVSAGAHCADGTRATRLTLAGSARALDSVTIGSPVRVYERAVYRLYADEGGAWWLGVRTRDDAGWAAISPVAGPLNGRAGLVFASYDALGAATWDPARVERIAFTVRGVSGAVLQEVGGRQERYADSLTGMVALRNGRRGTEP